LTSVVLTKEVFASQAAIIEHFRKLTMECNALAGRTVKMAGQRWPCAWQHHFNMPFAYFLATKSIK